MSTDTATKAGDQPGMDGLLGWTVGPFPAELFILDGDAGLVARSGGAWSDFGASATSAGARIASLDTSRFIGVEGELFAGVCWPSLRMQMSASPSVPMIGV